ncbi:MAG: ComEA family DNA-binding protein [Thermoanaerobaculales bacterium]
MKKETVCSLILVVLAITTLAVAGTGATEGVVNINSADTEQLQMLPRVGPALAGRIVEFREANGAFQSVDEIVAVKGIGERSFEKLKPYIVTDGETTLKEKVHLPRSTGGENAAND